MRNIKDFFLQSIIFFLAIIIWPGTSYSKTQLLNFEPKVEEITGVIVKRIVYGPPNYGETPSQDAKMTVTILLLREPIDILKDESGLLNQESFSGIKEIQVIFPQKKTISDSYFNRPVLLRGTIFTGHSGHHVTKVVMQISKIKRQQFRGLDSNISKQK